MEQKIKTRMAFVICALFLSLRISDARAMIRRDGPNILPPSPDYLTPAPAPLHQGVQNSSPSVAAPSITYHSVHTSGSSHTSMPLQPPFPSMSLPQTTPSHFSQPAPFTPVQLHYSLDSTPPQTPSVSWQDAMPTPAFPAPSAAPGIDPFAGFFIAHLLRYQHVQKMNEQINNYNADLLADRSVGLFSKARRSAREQKQKVEANQKTQETEMETEACFPADTPINVRDNSSQGYHSQAISTIRVGDTVVSCKLSVDGGTCEFGEVQGINVRTATHLLRLTYGDKELRSTDNHPFYVVERRGWVQADLLQVGQHLLTISGEEVALESKEEEWGNFIVYNLDVKGNHNYYACDVLVHNCDNLAVLATAASSEGANIIGSAVSGAMPLAIPLQSMQEIREGIENLQAHSQGDASKDSTGQSASDFEKSLVGLPPGERVAKVREKAAEVAKEQGWTKNNDLSKKNNRPIYTDKKGDHYSVDTQHGTWEKLNKRGRHQGEFDMDLKPLEPADPSGGHDIEI